MTVVTLAMAIIKPFWALWDNIYDCMFTALDLPVIPDAQFISNLTNW
jgi:hypothetical protein